jgi:hypothetical protein
MASNTRVTKSKRARKHARGGHARKVKQSQRSTLSAAELFAACGEPGQRAPKQAAAATRKA